MIKCGNDRAVDDAERSPDVKRSPLDGKVSKETVLLISGQVSAETTLVVDLLADERDKSGERSGNHV